MGEATPEEAATMAVAMAASEEEGVATTMAVAMAASEEEGVAATKVMAMAASEKEEAVARAEPSKLVARKLW